MGDEYEVRHLDNGLVIRRATVAPASIDAEHRTAEVVWSTGARVLRAPFFGEKFYEELSLSPGHVRLERLTSGRAPVLDAHDGWDTRGVIGVVEAARVENGEGTARVRFAKDDARGEVVWNKVRQGILQNVSIGYQIHRLEKVESGEGSVPVYRATDWEPFEISVVPMGADAGAAFRAATFPLHEEPPMEPQKNSSAAVVVEPVPPVPPVLTEHRDEIDVTHAILAPEESVRAYLQAHGLIRQPEYAKLTFGALARALVTGPRTALEQRVLAEGSDSTGGVTVPDVTMADFIDRLRSAVVTIRAGARTVPLTSDKTTVARITTDPTAAWRNENASVATSDAVFDGVVFTPRSLAVITQASRELLEDSVNIEEALTSAFVRSFAVELDRVALQGSGSAPQPRGVQNTTGITNVDFATNGAAPTAATWYPKVVATLAAVWTAPSTPTAIIMHPRTFGEQEGLLDTQNNAVRAPASVSGLPQLLASSMSVTETQGTSGAVASSLLTGDWSQLWIGIRSATRIEVLRELYAGNYQYGFLVNLRADIGVAQPAAFARLRGIL